MSRGRNEVSFDAFREIRLESDRREDLITVLHNALGTADSIDSLVSIHNARLKPWINREEISRTISTSRTVIDWLSRPEPMQKLHLPCMPCTSCTRSRVGENDRRPQRGYQEKPLFSLMVITGGRYGPSSVLLEMKLYFFYIRYGMLRKCLSDIQCEDDYTGMLKWLV